MAPTKPCSSVCPNSEGLFGGEREVAQQKVALTTTHLPQRPGYDLVGFHAGETRAHLFQQTGFRSIRPIAFIFLRKIMIHAPTWVNPEDIILS